jgi:ATPase subunit of ABC transporter with duplicated ATPase domains
LSRLSSSAALVARGLSYRHAAGVEHFSQNDLSVPWRGRASLVGPNGAGKTTLLEILADLRSASSGAVERGGPVTLLAQSPAVDHRSLLERLSLLPGEEWEKELRLEAAAEKLLLGERLLRRPLRETSGGERTRLCLAECLVQEPEVLLLDEPTNHLDRRGRERLLALLERFPGAWLISSHDRELLRLAETTWEISPRGLRRYGGNYDHYREQRDTEEAAAIAARETARGDLKRARENYREAVERQSKRAERGRKQAERANLPPVMRGTMKEWAEQTIAGHHRNHQRRVEQAETILRERQREAWESDPLHLDLTAVRVPRGKTLLRAKRLVFRYPGAAPVWARPLDLELNGPERLALKGPSGSGKSTLLNLIRGAGPAGDLEGELRLSTARVAYLDQHLSLIDPRLSVVDNLARFAPNLPRHELRTRLARARCGAEAAEKPAASLSGGERLRLALAATFASAPELLLLDEPTNHLDLTSLRVLENALRDYAGGLLVVSHDRDFLRSLGIEREVILI